MANIDSCIVCIDDYDNISSNLFLMTKSSRSKRGLLGLIGDYDTFKAEELQFICNRANRVYMAGLYSLVGAYKYGFDTVFDRVKDIHNIRHWGVSGDLKLRTGKALISKDKLFELDYEDAGESFDIFSLLNINMLYSFYKMFDYSTRVKLLTDMVDLTVDDSQNTEIELQRLIGPDYFSINTDLYNKLSKKLSRTTGEEEQLKAIVAYKRAKRLLNRGVALDMQPFNTHFIINAGKFGYLFDIDSNEYYHINFGVYGSDYGIFSNKSGKEVEETFNFKGTNMLDKEVRVNKLREVARKTYDARQAALSKLDEENGGKHKSAFSLKEYYVNRAIAINNILYNSNYKILLYMSNSFEIDFIVSKDLDINSALSIIVNEFEQNKMLEYIVTTVISPQITKYGIVWNKDDIHNIDITQFRIEDNHSIYDGRIDDSIADFKKSLTKE